MQSSLCRTKFTSFRQPILWISVDIFPQYLVCPPSLAWTARMHLLILCTWRPTFPSGLPPPHFLRMIRCSSPRVVSGLIGLFTFFFWVSHLCSIVDSSLHLGSFRSVKSAYALCFQEIGSCMWHKFCIKKNPSPTVAAYGLSGTRQTKSFKFNSIGGL